MKPLVIYHADCADGFGAAFAAWLKLGDSAEYLPMQYGMVKTSADFDAMVSLAAKGNEVYILDFSFSRVVMEHIFANAKRVVWLDHHKTAFEMWCGVQYLDKIEGVHQAIGTHAQHTIILNNFKSGALLAWEFFHPSTEPPMLIRHIDDRDRWQFAIEGSREFHAALWSYRPWSFEQWSRWNFHCPGKSQFYWETVHSGAAILRAHEQNVAAVVDGAARPCEIDETLSDRKVTLGIGLAANCPPHLASDVGHVLATQSGTFGLLWFIDSDGRCRCSLRSNGDYDVSAIARVFGGGGHKNAAGFTVAIETLLEWIK